MFEMLSHIRNKTFILKKVSSNLIKIFQASRKCHYSAVGEFEKYEDDAFDDDRPFHRKHNQSSRKYDFNSSYNKSSRFNKFQPRKYEYTSGFSNLTSKHRFDTASESKVKKDQIPTKKFFYVEHPDITNRLDDEIEKVRNQMNMCIRGTNIPKPITKFSELCLPEDLMKALNDEKYLEPSAIQCQGWPIALSGRDMIGVSQTGSGKTLAYMLPAVVHAANQEHSKVKKDECKPQVLVLGPTRELVQQIHQVSKKFIGACGLTGATVYGGASRNFQLCSLEGAEICIATPGRLLDFLSTRDASLENCSYLVLDEADRMLDMGFEPQIRDIVDQMRSDRQTLMWSATWPSEVRNLAEDFLTDYIHVTIGTGDLVANPNIEQKIYVVDEEEKEERIVSLLESIVGGGKNKVLVFAQTKRKVDHLATLLNRRRIRSRGIHGDYSQSRRDSILNSFRNDKSSVLIATDIAARGLDITDINHVVNYDFPPNIEDYIHRIGRTARGSACGVAHSYFTDENAGLSKELLSVLKKANQEINPDLYTFTERSKRPSMKYGGYKPYNRRYR